ncbi:MAG: sugar transferase [Cytophagaceae bacterium]|nr:sugar transferase [Cytophagaceae bacterium]|tara:strand:+ start:18275 stop:19171 length:897 start_codon:yes stop_codon:yes gene_type:complete
MTAPVLLFTYKKLEPLKQSVIALRRNHLASDTALFVFSDGPKTERDATEINDVREYLATIHGFKEVTIYASETNKGLATSIITGVSKILKTHESCVVLEDDLITSTNFLDFMNQALTFYKNNSQVHSISGYSMPIKPLQDEQYDNYFTMRASSWGWATWRDRWQEVDWEVSGYSDFKKDATAQKQFNAMGSDMAGMLNKQMTGQLDSWAIRWCFDQFQKKTFSVFPLVSKISNEGFGEKATNTKERFNRYKTKLDETGKRNFGFNPKPHLQPYYIKQFYRVYSLTTRIGYKILNTIFR